MAYLAGGAANAMDLMSQLSDFLTTSAGWTLVDTVGLYDKVLKSSGVGGKSNNVMRLQIDQSQALYKGNAHPMNAIEWVLMRGYHGWDSGTHTGTREFSQIGPWLYINGGGDNNTAYFHQIASPTPAANRWSRGLPTGAQSGNLGVWNGRSGFTGVYVSGASVWHEGLVVLDSNFVGTGSSYMQNWVYDPVTDREYLYVFSSTSTRIDLKNLTTISLAYPPWVWGAGCATVWDGGDKIYGFRGGGNATWAYYSISANTWTSMPTPLPANRSVQFMGRGLVYLPASASNFGEDCILSCCASADASFSTVYRWGITSATWYTHAIGFTVGKWSELIYDGHNSLYLYNQNDATYRGDLTLGWPSSWVNCFGGIGSNNGTNSMSVADSVCAKIHAHSMDGIGFWFIANADRVIVVTNVKGYYYWSYFGKYTSAIKTATMLTTSGVSAGTNVSVPVDSSVGFTVGEFVNVTDPSNGTWERAYITQVPDSLHVVVSLSNPYTSGSILTADWPVVGTSDCMLGVHPVDVSGYASDYQTSFSRLRAICDNTSVIGAGYSTIRKQFQFVPVVLYQDQLQTEVKGQLAGVYMTSGAALAAEEEILADGKRYKFFPSTEIKHAESKDFFVGPLE